jgi:hypothetical protein
VSPSQENRRKKEEERTSSRRSPHSKKKKRKRKGELEKLGKLPVVFWGGRRAVWLLCVGFFFCFVA